MLTPGNPRRGTASPRIVLKPEHMAAIKAHAARCYPEECIGVLGGHAGDEKRVVEVRPMVNAQATSRHNRSLIAPGDYLKLDREYRARGLKMVAFYHSHPDHPAKPSEYDRENALPWHSYVIVRVVSGEPEAITSWLLTEDRAAFDPEELVVEADQGDS